MALPRTTQPSMTEALDEYLKAFNDNDLDRVMTHFADDAVYRPGNGVERVGRAAIREEFEPQFHYALGAMRWDEIDRVVDERSRKIVIRYVCRHDLAHAKPPSLALKLLRLAFRLRGRDRFGWEGVDVLHFDDVGRITGKYTYAGYTRPRLEKALGVALPPPRATAPA